MPGGTAGRPVEKAHDSLADPSGPAIDPAQFVKLFHPGLPQAEEDAGAHPLLEAVMRGRVGAQVRLVQRLPLAAGAQHIEDGIGTDPGGRPRAPATKPVGVDVGGEQGLQHRPECIGDAKPGGGPVIRRSFAASFLVASTPKRSVCRSCTIPFRSRAIWEVIERYPAATV